MVHEADALADLPDKHHTVYFCQVVVVVDDSFKELSAFHTAWGWTAGSPGALCPVSPSCRAPWPPCRPPALPRHSQLHEEDDLPGGLNGIVELDEVAVVQLVHHIDLQQHHLL